MLLKERRRGRRHDANRMTIQRGGEGEVGVCAPSIIAGEESIRASGGTSELRPLR